MQKAIIVERVGQRSSKEKLELDRYLAKGWVVEKMEAFHVSCSVATGSSYGSPEIHDPGAILVIIENLGVEDPVEDPV